MKKFIAALTILISLSSLSIAQSGNMAVGFNGTMSIPIGDFNDIAKMGFGASGSFFFKLSDSFEATGTLGFISWGGDKLELTNTSSSSVSGSFTTIPVLVGGRYIMDGETFLPYVSGELGFHIFSSGDQKVEINDIVVANQKGETNLYFGLGLGVGAIYEVSREIRFDGGLQYNSISGESSIGHFSLELGLIVGIN